MTRLRLPILLVSLFFLAGCAATLTARVAVEPHDIAEAPPGFRLSGDWSLDVTRGKLPGAP